VRFPGSLARCDDDRQNTCNGQASGALAIAMETDSQGSTHWLVRLAAGEREASAALYEELLPRMRSFALLVAGESGRRSPDEVDALVHDVFVDVLLRRDDALRPSFASVADLRAYLATAIRHLVITRSRQRERRGEQALPSGSAAGPAARGAGPATCAAVQDGQSMALRRVEQAMLTLPEHYRIAIGLRWVSGMSSAQIIAELRGADGTPAQHFATEQQVRSTLFHAMAKLREVLRADAASIEEYFAELDR
jgi:RNA polymerase sigma factor (sigma-70 family)